MPQNTVDILGNGLQSDVLKRLLLDHTTKRNIFWATHDYEHLGNGFQYTDEIRLESITGENGQVIKPRVLKSKEQQTDRSKDMAEVFTPSRVVKMMVDYIDIGINTRCLEITCGEAPFLVSRYDATTGEPIAINERVGVLDRKLRMILNQQPDDEEWLTQVRLAFQSTYGYEWQGDSLLLARENLLHTFVEHYEKRYGCTPDMTLLKEFAEIISWNIFQMDGLTYRTPQLKKEEQPKIQLSLFDEAPTPAPSPLCIIMDWQTGKTIKVNDIKNRLTKSRDNMKFDVIIGNPPYQEERTGDNKQFAPPIYNYFIDEAHKIADITELVTPARFLFNAGSTPKEWNIKMLNNKHFKVLYYENDSSKFFGGTCISGGVAISYYDNTKVFIPIRTFTVYPETKSIMFKVVERKDFTSIVEIIDIQSRFNLSILLKEYPMFIDATGGGRDNRLEKNIFEKISIFTNSPTNKDDIKILGIFNRDRTWKYICRKFIETSQLCLFKHKVIVSVSNGGAGNLGDNPARIIGEPLIEYPGEGYTRTFIGIGAFEKEIEAKNCSKYVLTRFARLMIGISKTTQMINRDVWRYVPLQDFTPSSDINWSKSIAEIDEQLFDKYGLDEAERDFIRTKVKEMA
ncbi:MAG: Eco57I restriction-modification methylase domain-containing protein [Prevotella sp.]|nr:Eco57I restriction-modification methylase domain-containing protein [Prevotella sp.]